VRQYAYVMFRSETTVQHFEVTPEKFNAIFTGQYMKLIF
jgi:hypothetical protein